MPMREVVDEHQRTWTIWRVQPEFVERRQQIDQVVTRQVGERRRRQEWRASLGSEYVRGWLAFETAGERRRLAPVPEGWHELTDGQLLELLARAVLVPSRRRLP